MATDPTFFSTAVTKASVISAATAYGGTRTSPTGLTTIFNGSTTKDRMVRRVDIKALGVTVAGLLELWLYDGTTHYLIPGMRAPIMALTPSTTVDPWGATIEPGGGLFIPAAGTAWELRAGASTSQTGAISIVAQGAEA